MIQNATLRTSINKIKTMQKTAKILSPKHVLVLLAVLCLVGAPARTLLLKPAGCSSSSDCRSQIGGLEDQNDSARAALNALLAQAGSYQAALDILNAQIASINEAIAATQAKEAEIQTQIDENQAKLNQQRDILSADIKAMYVDGQMSTIEMLATSKNLSDYVDKEEYRSVVQSKIQKTMHQIAILENQLAQQKADVESLLANQQSQEAILAADQAQENSMLAYNQSQQAAFNAQINGNTAKIRQLEAEQAALNQQGTQGVYVPGSGGAGGLCDNGKGNGGYPMQWCNVAQDSVRTSFGYSNNNRECTSFAFWYFTSVLGHLDFRVSGNANQWLGTSSYPTHSIPAVGGLAVETAGTFGHVAVVQALSGQTYQGLHVPDGYLLVSEMNYDYNGHFRYSFSPLSKFTGYIY
jgi:peptidoglycan hydrolase CwlO-like protein